MICKDFKWTCNWNFYISFRIWLWRIWHWTLPKHGSTAWCILCFPNWKQKCIRSRTLKQDIDLQILQKILLIYVIILEYLIWFLKEIYAKNYNKFNFHYEKWTGPYFLMEFQGKANYKTFNLHYDKCISTLFSFIVSLSSSIFKTLQVSWFSHLGFNTFLIYNKCIHFIWNAF